MVTVTAHNSDGSTVTGRLDAWDEHSITIDGTRYRGPVVAVTGAKPMSHLTERQAVDAAHPRFVSALGDRRERPVPCATCEGPTLAIRPLTCVRCLPISADSNRKAMP